MTAPLNGIPTFVNWTMVTNETGLWSPLLPAIDAKALLSEYSSTYPDLKLSLCEGKDKARIFLYRGDITLECYKKYPDLAEVVHLVWQDKFIKPPEDVKYLQPEEIPAYNARIKVRSEEEFRAKLQKRFDEAQKTLGQTPNIKWDIAVGVVKEESSSEDDMDLDSFSEEDYEDDAFSEEESADIFTILNGRSHTTDYSNIFALKPGCEKRKLETGSATAIGRRQNQEDQLCVKMLQLGERVIPCFGVFDGHDGFLTASLLSEASILALINPLKMLESSPKLDEQSICDLLTTLYVHLGRDIKQHFPEERAGSTALFAMIIDDILWVDNVGDTRAILCRNGAVTALSIDANFGSKKAFKSAWKRGQNVFNVLETMRVRTLNMHRAVGHNEMTSGINPRGHVMPLDLNNLEKGEYHLLIASDGLWGHSTSEQVAARVAALAAQHASCEKIAGDLIVNAVEAGSLDNVTALVVKITV
jgi:serine/threonine protein phosphatase PrpC